MVYTLASGSTVAASPLAMPLGHAMDVAASYRPRGYAIPPMAICHTYGMAIAWGVSIARMSQIGAVHRAIYPLLKPLKGFLEGYIGYYGLAIQSMQPTHACDPKGWQASASVRSHLVASSACQPRAYPP